MIRGLAIVCWMLCLTALAEDWRETLTPPQAEVQGWRVSKLAGSSPPKWRKFKCADVFDLHTALLFTRSQPMGAGDIFRLAVYPARDAYLAEP